MDAHFAAMKMMRPGLYEYQVAARMVEIHSAGGCEAEAYAPIVGAGFQLHRAALQQDSTRKFRMAISCCSTSAGNTPATPRTSRARFRPTASSRRASAKSTKSCYGAQNAALAAIKPG